MTFRFDNHAAEYATLTAYPLSSAMGAEIRGVDLADLSDEQFADVEAALFAHGMIFFRDQHIDHADQERLTLRFGPHGKDAYTTGIEGHPNVTRVVKEAEDRVELIFGGNWHTDSPFLERPPAVSLLYGVDIPPYGGDTWWANSALAYAALSEKMKAVLAPLNSTFSAEHVIAALRRAKGSLALTASNSDFEGERHHPLVRTHPRPGRKALYVDENYTVGIEGMKREEAEPITRYLVAHVTQPVFTCRLRWEPNTFAIWDNRLTIHQAFNDYDGFRREMYRTTVEGEVPA